jgi:hypothetical protein
MMLFRKQYDNPLRNLYITIVLDPATQHAIPEEHSIGIVGQHIAPGDYT